MALPPDDRRPTPGEAPAEPSPDPPTIAWTPPDLPPPDLPMDGPAGNAPEAAPEATATPPADPAPPAEPASPLISWTPSGGAAHTPPPGAPLVGWQVPDDAGQPSPIAGYALAGVGARVVAYLIDGILLSTVVTVIQAIVAPGYMPFDLSAGSIDQLPPPVFSLEAVLVGVIGMGLDFIYLVGLWTSRGRATLGMRLLKLQVVDMASGHRLTISQGAARWLLLSGAIGIIGLVPVAIELAGLIGFLWLIVLLVTTTSHPLKQGVHDRAANSIVVRPADASSNTALVGCMVLVVVFVILPIVALILFGGRIEQILSEVGQSI